MKFKWHLAQKVVCVYAGDTNDSPGEPTIREGSVYIIDWIGVSVHNLDTMHETDTSELCFHLFEVPRNP